ncbi:AAA family ATPase [Nannocystaceae bacterium ST9]
MLSESELVALVQKLEADPPQWVSDWRRRVAKFLAEVASADLETRSSREFQLRLWNDNPITSAGQGEVAVAVALDDVEFREWLARASFDPLPLDAVEKRNALERILARMWEQFEGQRKPWLKMFRLLAALYPDHFTCLSSTTRLHEYARLLLAGPPARPIEQHLALCGQFERLLGPANATAQTRAQRMTLHWMVYERVRQANAESPIAIVEDTNEERLIPLPADRRRRGLIAFKGLSSALRQILAKVGAGMTGAELREVVRAAIPDYNDSSLTIVIRSLQTDLGVLQVDDERFVLTPSGQSLFESEDSDALAEWLLTRVLGVDVAIAALRPRPLSKPEWLRAIQRANPRWTSSFAPNGITSWLLDLGVVESIDGQCQLTERGRSWAELIHWVPVTLDVDAPNETPESEPEPEAFFDESETFELHVDLRADGRACLVRLHGTESWSQAPSLLPSIADDSEFVGKSLFGILFHEQSLLGRYRELRAVAHDRHMPLRVVLHMHADVVNPDRHSIADHCWETLLDPQHGRIASDLALRLVRVRAGLHALEVPRARPRLHALVGFACPRECQVLDFHHERISFKKLTRSLQASTLVDFNFHEPLDIESLRTHIRASDSFHFGGHGEVGGLVLEDSGSHAQVLDSEVLRAMLTPPLPCFVVLNACHGSVAEDALSAAHAFLERGVHAVVAMNGEFADRAAASFVDELYTRLVAGSDVEAAVQSARWRLLSERSDSWFMPVLWTRTTASFALVDRNLADANPVVRERVEQLDRYVREHRPRVAIRDRIDASGIAADLDASRRSELAESLLERVAVDDPDRFEVELDKLLGDASVTHQVAQLRRRASSPSGELHELAEALRRDVVPPLGAAASSLPALIAALEAMTRPAPTPPVEPAPPREYVDVERPLTLEGSLDAMIPIAKAELELDDEIVRRCLIHLLAGRHLVLAGPPGTGKSTLAQGLARAFGFAAKMTTANPDWTTYDTIGGLAPIRVRDEAGRGQVGYEFQPGHVLRAIEANWVAREGAWRREKVWLVIDEMNRAPLDQAFGALFTALVERRLEDPRIDAAIPLPADFRLICTANTSDRRLLFEFSEALKRRFAFVEIPAFRGSRGLGGGERLLSQLRKRGVWGDHDIENDFSETLAKLDPIVDRLRILHPLGLAHVLDVLMYVLVARAHGRAFSRQLLTEALVDNLLPVLESQPSARLDALASLLAGGIRGWLDRCVTEMRAYRADPVALRVAIELVRGSSEFDEPKGELEAWLAARVESRGPELDEWQALPYAAEFTLALQRLAAERSA